ncbi:MAG: CDP-glycerol glycerophosphotransferase family protein [Candidatus Delongbacteria bacterium]|nr:CDP-glycerol glycerophosphotransferase family protein [Candidatus Delongbacteria bacterium]MDD4204498.1 CDP-glycerol glycerophosphotransferase family protein [Candidatus Delongbacteria bacterium]
MNFSNLIYKYPYIAVWYIVKLFNKLEPIVFYCADPLDYEMFMPVKKYLPEIKIVAKNRKTKKYLKEIGIDYICMPVFPKAVIMARHTPYKFPVNKIVKFGFDHGLYQFKKWTNPKTYNNFNIYFVSSNKQVENAEKLGIKTTYAIGYPKLDKAFDGTITPELLEKLRDKSKIDRNKKTVLFTSTWNIDGLSQLDKWIDNVHLLTDKYNILLTVHTWTEKSKVEKLRNIPKTYFIEDHDITDYLMIADVMVGDYNSLIGEFCAFDKPLITFKVPESLRTIPEIIIMLSSISIQIDNFSEIEGAIEKCLDNPDEKSSERKNANETMFFALDGTAGKRMANKIIDKLLEFNVSVSNK